MRRVRQRENRMVSPVCLQTVIAVRRVINRLAIVSIRKFLPKTFRPISMIPPSGRCIRRKCTNSTTIPNPPAVMPYGWRSQPWRMYPSVWPVVCRSRLSSSFRTCLHKKKKSGPGMVQIMPFRPCTHKRPKNSTPPPWVYSTRGIYPRNGVQDHDDPHYHPQRHP